MRKLPFAMVLLAAPAIAQVADVVGDGTGYMAGSVDVPIYISPEGEVYDNGPLITDPGMGYGGADASALQTLISGNIYGYGHQIFYNYLVADDFTAAAAWDLSEITFYCYQTGGGSGASTITANNFTIYSGDPSTGGAVFHANPGSTINTNAWSGIFRCRDVDLLANQRAIMAVTVDATAVPTLASGATYWMSWQHDGSLSSGPWVPPVTWKGAPGVGNGYQSLDGGITWNPLLDTLALWPDDLKFKLFTGGGPAFSLASGGGCPGPVTFTATGATPGGWVAFAYGRAGNTTIPGAMACGGTVLDISRAKKAGTVAANGVGTAIMTKNVPAAGCSFFVQAIDVSTCATSNVVNP